MTVREIEAKLAEVREAVAKLNADAGDALFSDEQRAQFEKLEAEHGSLIEAKAKAEKELEARRAIVAERATKTDYREKGVEFVERKNPETESVIRMGIREARDKALSGLEEKAKDYDLPARSLDSAERQIRKDSDIARRFLVTETDEYRSAFVKLTTRTNPVLTPEEASAVLRFEEYRAMSEGTGSAGGFGLPILIDPSIILTTQGAVNPFLEICRITDITTNVWKGVTSGGMSWGFAAEAAATSDNSPTLTQPVVDVRRAQGFIPFSIEVGMDYPDFAGEMATLIDAGYNDLLVNKLATGAGAASNEPTGVITYLDGDSTSQVRLTTAGSFGEVDLYNTWKALPQRWRNNARFMMSVGVNNAIRRFGAANVYHAFTVNVNQPAADQLFGKQVHENPYFPDVVSTTGHVNQLVVGDWSNYLIARRAGMTVELVPQLVDVTNNRPTGQRGWFAYARIGGSVINDNGFRLLNQT